mmetsp:Transcript_13083/g.30829  ORF Transcript_13083/g.30829 Transcript_13083/m.30829 type:complete len:99 (-) Transcript_13083:64-360(-)
MSFEILLEQLHFFVAIRCRKSAVHKKSRAVPRAAASRDELFYIEIPEKEYEWNEEFARTNRHLWHGDGAISTPRPISLQDRTKSYLPSARRLLRLPSC